MQYLLDTANIEDIRRYTDIFPIAGVTTNPTIVKREGKIDFFDVMHQIREIIGSERSFHIQVTAKDTEGMLRDADAIRNRVDEQVYVKIPVTMDGIRAIRLLKAQGFRVTATAVYGQTQAFLALEAGADYLAPYYNRMENMGISPDNVIHKIADMIDKGGYHTKILAASFKNAGQVECAFTAGAQAATVNPSILTGALNQAHILGAVDTFVHDWQSVYGDRTIAQL